ncbi:hypothetical protein [Peribacillus saganii]|uniref:hypothetical protein n=1 Tax=Peribacillus saganii TaxID=2303992 RepID=UPI0026C008BD|nr:hypothetical protein [Peribacillus saganii]
MIERLYGEEVKYVKFDLVYCIKGFMNTYSELFLFYNLPLDLKLLSQSLVEKTTVLAKHTTIPFISQELIQMVKEPMSEELSKEQILEIAEEKIAEIEESID